MPPFAVRRQRGQALLPRHTQLRLGGRGDTGRVGVAGAQRLRDAGVQAGHRGAGQVRRRRGFRGRARGGLVGELPGPGAERTGAPRRAREPRHRHGHRPAARRARRRDGQPLLPDAQRQRGRRRLQAQQRLQRRGAGVPARHQACRCRPGRAVGARPERPPARRRRRGRGRGVGGRTRRARRAPAGDVRRGNQLLHAGRRAAPARHIARDLRRAGRDAAPGAGAAPRRPGDAVRRRAGDDPGRIVACADSTAGDGGRGRAAPHRGAGRRPGRLPPMPRASSLRAPPPRCRSPSPGSRPRCCSAGPMCWR